MFRLALAGVALAFLVAGCGGGPADSTHGSQIAPPSSASPTAAPRTEYGPQSVLPFTGLDQPSGAVDGAGSVYVADFTNNRVVKSPGR